MAKQTSKATKSAGFISDDAVSSGQANYLKFQAGENAFRIISNPVEGEVLWVDKKPVRAPLGETIEEEGDDDSKQKKFIAVVVIDRADGGVKMLEITQQSVIKAIKALAANPAWGAPHGDGKPGYDIIVTKTGESLKTKYTVTPSPKKKLSKEDVKAAGEKPCDLDALFDGADPWEGDATEYFLG